MTSNSGSMMGSASCNPAHTRATVGPLYQPALPCVAVPDLAVRDLALALISDTLH